MATVKTEKVNRNANRIWGSFKLSDGTTTKFEMVKGNGWNQWGNSTDNLYLTVSRVEHLCNDWLTQF
jgi:hypothetical protein